MGVHDPRRLTVILEDLKLEMQRWSVRASDTIKLATYTQRQAREKVEQAYHNACIVEEQARSDRQVVNDLMMQVRTLLDKCEEAIQTAKQTSSKTQAAKLNAEKTLAHWKDELQYALEWLARAIQRVARARRELELAQNELREAERELSYAESALSRCRNSYTTDSEGRRHYRDCSAESARVARARAAVEQAKARVRAAEIELQAALAEQARAERRVEACKVAVSYAQSAVETAIEANERAVMATNAAERSMERAQASQRSSEAANSLVMREEEHSSEMMRHVNDAQRLVRDEAEVHLRMANRSEESAQRYHILARHELNYRIDRLLELNRPDLNMGMAISTTARVTGGIKGESSGGASISKKLYSNLPNNTTHVNVLDIMQPDDITGPEDFKKVSVEEMEAGMHRLQEMLPSIENGEGATGDYWSQKDQAEALEYKDGYRRVYDAFFGDDRIRLSKTGDTYDVINGRHRIWLAKRMGWSSIPAFIDNA